MKKIFYIFSLMIIFFCSSCIFISKGTVVGDASISKYGISFNDMLYEYDGTEKKLEISGDLPHGFTVKYDNNVGKESGEYYATCYLYDQDNKLVETHYGTLIIENDDNLSFDIYLNQFLTWYISGDQFACNLFFESPAEFNLQHTEASWYSYDQEYTSEMLNYYKDAFTEMQLSLKDYESRPLSTNQRVAYNQLYSFFEYYKKFYSIEDAPYLTGRYIDQFGGYVANFISSIEIYPLRKERDIEDMIKLISSTESAFTSYINFIDHKTNKGYPFSKFTLTEMNNYLLDLINQKDDFYLIDILESKINNTSFDKDIKDKYIGQMKNIINDCFFTGISNLQLGLEKYLINSTDLDGYLNTYDQGSELYEIELENLLGINNLYMDDYIDLIDTNFENSNKEYQKSLNNLVLKYKLTSTSDLNKLIEDTVFYNGTPEEMMEYLKEFSKTMVPNLEVEPNIIIKEMDEASAKVSNAVAYYTKSAIDSNSTEYITLNPLNIDNENDLLFTLAHEGYPGHLYAYCFMKNTDIHPAMKIMTSTAHAEGWATYVSLKLCDYLSLNSSSQKEKDILSYYKSEQLNNYLLESKIDLYIHLKNWKVNDVYSYLEKNGFNANATSNVYNLLIEMPTTYNAYSIGKVVFTQLHEMALDTLGKNIYKETEINEVLLSKGWTGLDELFNTYNTYMRRKTHKYGLDFVEVENIYQFK